MEKRKAKRMELEAGLVLKRLDGTGGSGINVTVTDLSRLGIGFSTSEELDLNSYFNGDLKIWTKEVFPVNFKIVRKSGVSGNFSYGAEFIALGDVESMKIKIYEMLNPDA